MVKVGGVVVRGRGHGRGKQVTKGGLVTTASVVPTGSSTGKGLTSARHKHACAGTPSRRFGSLAPVGEFQVGANSECCV